jgi:ligand-binding SRPBCC domain-containing protein
MADYVLERRIWLPAARPEVFAFFADAANLPLITPPAARFRWRAPPPDRLTAFEVLDFSVRIAGWPARWRAFIREFDPPHRFVDVQIWGPFARWEHRHRFIEGTEREEGGGPPGTWIDDRVTYRLPLGAFGRLAHALGVKRRIAELFDYRERGLREIFGLTTDRAAPPNPPPS